MRLTLSKIMNMLPDGFGAKIQNMKFKSLEDKNSCVWLWPTNIPNSADFIYCHTPKYKGFPANYNRALFKFPLVDGGEYWASGVWRSNSVSLLKSTGIDIRQRHFISFVIGLEIKLSPQKEILGIIELDGFDISPRLDYFNYPLYRAIELSRELDKKLHYISISNGGEQFGSVLPTDIIPDKNEKW